jgi:MFS family permease
VGGPTQGLAPLHHRGFRLLATGQLASNVGDAFYAVALPWYVLADHGGPVLLAVVLAAYGIPRTALVAVGGHASDRWQPWTVMMTADATRAVSLVALAVAAWSGPADPAILIPIAVVIGAGEGLFLPGSFSIIPSLLPDADLQAGNALASSSTQLATLIGPAIGGGLVALAGPAPAFAVDAASFVVSAASLAGIRAIKRPASSDQLIPAPTGGVGGQQSLPDERASTIALQPHTRTLLDVLRTERVLQIILVVTFAANLGSGGMSEVALPALAHGPFHAGAAGYGALIAAFGGGALIGTIVAGQIRAFRRPAVVGSIAFGGALNGFGNILTITAFQRWAPPELLGRLMGVLLLCSFGIFPVSVALGGLVVHDFGPAPFFPVAAGILAIAVIAGLTQRPWRQFGSGPGS